MFVLMSVPDMLASVAALTMGFMFRGMKLTVPP